MDTRWHILICLLGCFSLSAAYYYTPNTYQQPWSNYLNEAAPHRAGLAVDQKMTQVPLMLVRSDRIKLVNGGAIYYQPTYYGIRELAAIRLELQRPMTVSQPTTMIEFPASFTYYQDGQRVPFTVAAVLAPVLALRGPHDVHVVFAVPALGIPAYHLQPVKQPQPITAYYPTYQTTYQPAVNNLYNQVSQQYPSLASGGVYAPSVPHKPTAPYKPSTSYKPASQYKPPSKPAVFTPVGQYQGQSHNRPLVTILDFPSSVSSPGALYYQPPLGPDTELGNREPPQAVVPAGIVQSTAPLPNLSVFVNSKESAILQSLRDEAEKNRLATNAYHVNYDVIIN